MLHQNGADINILTEEDDEEEDSEARWGIEGASLLVSAAREGLSKVFERYATKEEENDCEEDEEEDNDDKDDSSNGETPLHSTANSGTLSTLKYLHENGGVVNVRCAMRETALHKAVSAGSLDCVKYLLENGSDIGMRDQYKRIAVHLAAIHKHRSLVEILVTRTVVLRSIQQTIKV